MTISHQPQRDSLGNPLSVGDTCAFVLPNSNTLLLGAIRHFEGSYASVDVAGELYRAFVASSKTVRVLLPHVSQEIERLCAIEEQYTDALSRIPQVITVAYPTGCPEPLGVIAWDGEPTYADAFAAFREDPNIAREDCFSIFTVSAPEDRHPVRAVDRSGVQ